MEIKILSERENPLLKRKEIQFRVYFNAGVPSFKDVRNEAISQLKLNEKLTIMGGLKTKFGSRYADCYAKVYKDEKSLKIEPPFRVTKNFEGKKKKEKAERAEGKKEEAKEKPKEEKKVESVKEEKPKEEKKPEAAEKEEEKTAEKQAEQKNQVASRSSSPRGMNYEPIRFASSEMSHPKDEEEKPKTEEKKQEAAEKKAEKPGAEKKEKPKEKKPAEKPKPEQKREVKPDEEGKPKEEKDLKEKK